MGKPCHAAAGGGGVDRGRPLPDLEAEPERGVGDRRDRKNDRQEEDRLDQGDLGARETAGRIRRAARRWRPDAPSAGTVEFRS